MPFITQKQGLMDINTKQGGYQMEQILVNYEAVNEEIARLRTQITSSVIDPVNAEYRQIQTSLQQVDGATNAAYQEALEINREKALAAANTMEKLLNFIFNSARQIQISEEQIARSFGGTRR